MKNKVQTTPVGIFFEDVTKDQQILMENRMIAFLDSAIGFENWKYADWQHGYFGMDLVFILPGEDEMSLTEKVVNRSMYAWSLMLAALFEHPNTRVVSWPHETDVREHLADRSVVIPKPTVTWAEMSREKREE